EDSGEDSQEHACAHRQVRAARRAEHLEQCARFLLILRIGCRHESPSAVQNPSAHSISVGPCDRGVSADFTSVSAAGSRRPCSGGRGRWTKVTRTTEIIISRNQATSFVSGTGCQASSWLG